jgi:hypothetical protein
VWRSMLHAEKQHAMFVCTLLEFPVTDCPAHAVKGLVTDAVNCKVAESSRLDQVNQWGMSLPL